MALPLSPNSPFSSPKRRVHPDSSEGGQKPSKYTKHGGMDPFKRQEKETPFQSSVTEIDGVFQSMGISKERVHRASRKLIFSPIGKIIPTSDHEACKGRNSPSVASLVSQCSERSSSSFRPSPSPPLITSPVRFDISDLRSFQNRVQMLTLLRPEMDRHDPALRLVRWFFEPERDQNAVKATRPLINEFFKMVSNGRVEARNKFIELLKPFTENARSYFADPLCELIEANQMAIAAQIFLAYVAAESPEQALLLVSNGEVAKLLQSNISYKPFPWLFEHSENVCGYIKTNLRNEFCPLMLKIIPEAYRRHWIDSVEIKLMSRECLAQVCSPGSRLICTIENEPLLDQVLEMLNGVRSVCQAPIEIKIIDQMIQEFKSIYVLDPKHLTEPQLRRGDLVGLHQYPPGGQATYETDETRMEVRVKYPHLIARSTFTAPYTANISSAGSSAYQMKISTFTDRCPDLRTQIGAIETVLSSPMNDPEREPENNRRHIGMVGEDAWMVYTNGRKIGTAFPIPLFESRDLDINKERRVIPFLQLQDELGMERRPVGTTFSPQKKLVAYVRGSLGNDGSARRHNRAASNQDIRPICDRIKQMLSTREGDYKLIPTPPGRPILVQISLAACGVGMRELLTSGYRSSGLPSGVTKRLKDEEIEEVFDAEDNGIYVVLRYPNIETFTRLVLEK